MERSTKIWVAIGTVILIGVALLLISRPTEEKCLVWQNVDEKFVYGGEYYLALPNASLMIPVPEDTYNWVQTGQSYNFYCAHYLGLAWKCDVSYECGECKGICQYMRDK